MSLTPYIITKKDKLFKALEKPLNIFKVLPQTEVSQDVLGSTKSVLLVGSHRIGASIIQAMNHDKNKLIVIDHNPEVTKGLTKHKIANVYGDIMSPDILNNINIKKLKLVICTLPGLKENMSLLKRIGKENPRARIILNAQRISEAKELYAKGADYVTMPKVIAGKEIANLITKGTKSRLRREKKEHLKYLEDLSLIHI